MIIKMILTLMYDVKVLDDITLLEVLQSQNINRVSKREALLEAEYRDLLYDSIAFL